MTVKLKPMPLWQSTMLFGVPTVVLFLTTRYAMPWLMYQMDILPVLSWFICGGLCVFIPLFIFAIMACVLEKNPISLRERLRLIPLTKKDWLWTLGSIIFVGGMMALIMFLANWLSGLTGLFPPISTSPPFLIDYHGLEKGQEWILLVWLPFFFFNIVGEELLWRGYILPRQELSHKKWAWLINAILWLVFHASFGLGMNIVLLPILFCIPYVAQKRENTWIGIIVHAIINGPAFVAISLGWI